MKYIVLSIIVISLLSRIIFLNIKARNKQNSEPNIITEFNNKVKNAKLTQELYLATPDNKKYDLIFFYITKYLKEKNYEYESICELQLPLRVFHFVDLFEREVNNGGFLQFFTNPSGLFIEETKKALILINASKTVELIDKALQCVIKHNQTLDKLRRPLLHLKLHEIFTTNDLYANNEMLSDLSTIDMEFYKSEEFINTLLMEYFESNVNLVFADKK